MSDNENEKRSEPRYAVGALVRVVIEGRTPKLLQASDISVHGIFIEMPDPPAVETEIWVGPDDVSLSGRVVFTLTASEAAARSRKPGVGVRLDREIDPDGFLLLCAEENAAARSSRSALSVGDVEAALAALGEEIDVDLAEPASPSSPVANPFGAPTSSPIANPFGAPTAPPSPVANPFGAPTAPTSPVANPFGAPTAPPSPVANPFGAPTASPPSGPLANPFGAPTASSPSGPVANPFGAPTASPPSGPVANPFGAPQSSAPVANPFGAPQSSAPVANPFAELGDAFAAWDAEPKPDVAAKAAPSAAPPPAAPPRGAATSPSPEAKPPQQGISDDFRAAPVTIRPALTTQSPSAALAAAARSARREKAVTARTDVNDAVIVDGIPGQPAFLTALTAAGFKTYVAKHGFEAYVLCLRRRPLLCIAPAEDRLLPGRLLIGDLRRRPELNGTAFALFDRSGAPNPTQARVVVFRGTPADAVQARQVVDYALGGDARPERGRGIEEARALANEVADLARRIAELNAPDLAILGMRYACEVAPSVSAHKLNLARLLLWSPDGRERDEASNIVEAVLRHEPRTPNAHVMRAFVFDAKGKREEAKLSLRRALQLEEANAEANAAIMKLENGERLVIFRSGTSVAAPSEHKRAPP